MLNLDEIYSREWYEHDFAGLQPEFDIVARGIHRWSVQALPGALRTAYDVGCGPGMLVAGLKLFGWDAVGIDGSAHAIDYARAHVPTAADRIVQADIRTQPGALSIGGNYYSCSATIAVCTEVAEHFPAEDAPALVRYLTDCAGRACIFTAAPPGQGGHHHINEQPPEYWVLEFQKRGWLLDRESTNELKARWHSLERLSHMTRNVMVFR